jgi:mono/diheme cytochrome c family protein
VGSLTTSAQTISNGQRIFAQSCASCHDAHGTAMKSGPGLKNYYREHRPRPSDAAVRSVIQQGRGTMPAFSNLNPAQLNDLIAYLKTL